MPAKLLRYSAAAIAPMVAGPLAAVAEPCHCADLNGDGVVNEADAQEYILLALAEDPKADFVAPFGRVDFFDFLSFLRLMETEPVEPNVLWLSFEDTSWYMLPAYGQDAVSTPNLDEKFFPDAVRFDRAWSTASVCSPARSTIISGAYATTYGSDFHRRAVNIPAEQYFFPRLLQDAGYYTTNNEKTDYNSIQSANAWHRSSGSASWTAAERAGRPFFSVFNSGHSHQVRIRSFHTDGRRDFDAMGITPVMPPYVPDGEDAYSDYQFHLESILGIDAWAGVHLDRLKQEGLDDETVVFFFSDHGGLLPRSKGYIFESGIRVPFGVRVPERLRCLLPDDLRGSVGSGSDRLVGFVDFAATILSIAGIEAPWHMQGEAFLGELAEPAREYQFAFSTNRWAHFLPDRAVTDGKYKYIRRFLPYRAHANRGNYQWGMPAAIEWDVYALESPPQGGDQRPEWMALYEPGSYLHRHEMLFDIEADPYEMNDLSEDPARAEDLERLRSVLLLHMKATRDLGLFPDSMRDAFGGVPIYDWVRDTNYDVSALIDAAWLASDPSPSDLPTLEGYLLSGDHALEFWGAAGCAMLAIRGQLATADLPQSLLALRGSTNWQVAAAAAEATALADEPGGIADQVARTVSNNDYAYSALETLSRFESVLPEIVVRSGPLRQVRTSNYRARAVLINLGQWPAADLYLNAYNLGLDTNQAVLPIGPLP